MTPSTQTKILLEIAVASLERAIAAQSAGAHRLELCSQLELGGLTPAINLVRQVRQAVQLPIHVMVRPRAGNFVYTAGEFAQMKSDITALRQENIQGIVTGILLPDSSIDIAHTRELVSLASPLEGTFHRAFDEVPDPFPALEVVIETGATRILTSGGAPSTPEGVAALRKLIQQAGGRATILPGGGIHAGNIAALVRATGAREIHTGLGTVIPYTSPDTQAFEAAIRASLANLPHS